MKPKPENQKYKQVRISDERLIRVKTFLNLSLLIAYERLKNNYDSEKEKFRDLICQGNTIEGFTEADYRQLSDEDLEKIAGEMLSVTTSTKASTENVFNGLFLVIDKEIKESMESVNRSIRPLQQKMAEALKPLQELNIRVAELLAPITSQIEAMSAQWSETVNRFLEEHREYLDVRAKASLIASKYDWFIAYDLYVCKEFYKELNRLDETSPSTQEIDTLFTDYYDEDIRKQVTSDLMDFEVTKEFEDLINQIEYGYEHKLFYLVIPALFVLIEGLIARGFQHQGRMNGTQFKGYINQLLEGNETESLQKIINKRMLVTFEHGKEINSPISRHAILHGGDIKFGTEAVALRLLLIFYNVAFAIGLRDIIKEP